MRESKESVTCAQCETPLEFSASQTLETRSPCPNCGSTRRRFEETIQEAVKVQDKLKFRHRSPGGNGFKVEHTEGDDLHRKTGRWSKLKRIIDRPNDAYEELIVDAETGEVVRDCKQPLSQHVGRGTPSKRNR